MVLILAPRLEVQGCRKVVLAGCFGSWGQDGPKKGPRSPKTAPKTEFGTILVDFCQIVGRFLVDFVRFSLGVGVLVCCCLVVCLACLLNFLAAGFPYPRHGGGDGPQGNWIRRPLCLHSGARRVQDLQSRHS